MDELKRSNRQHSWNLGERVKFTIESSLFEGVFECQVVGINMRRGILQVSMPKAKGKLVLVPVGTIVSVKTCTDNKREESYTVIDRTGGETRCLVLQEFECEGNKIINYESSPEVKIIGIASGKGGVGKTTLAVNLGIVLSEMGKRVCIFDAALGTANADVLLGVLPQKNLAHVIVGKAGLAEVLTMVNPNLYIVPGCSGVPQITKLTNYEYNHIATELKRIEQKFDIIIIDTRAGIDQDVTNFMQAAGKGYIITTPEPHAITDTYGLLKSLISSSNRTLDLSLIINRIGNKTEADDTVKKLKFAAKKFLDFELKYGGCIIEDYSVRQANMKQMPISHFESSSQLNRQISSMIRNIYPKTTKSVDYNNGFDKILSRFKRIASKR